MPTGDDIARFERDLCADGGAAIGATIRTFASLFDEIAVATAASIRPAGSAAAPRADPRRGRGRGSRSSGVPRTHRSFASALDLLIAELQAALVSPADLRSAAAGVDGSADLGLEVAALYRSTSDFATAPARSDAGQVAVAAAQAHGQAPKRGRRDPS